MPRTRRIAPRSFWSVAVLLTLMLTGSCDRPSPETPASAGSGEWRAFRGEWTAVGHRRTLDLADGRRSSIAEFNGHLRLSGTQRPNAGYNARALVFNDSSSGMVGRAVWTDQRGEKIFSELRGDGTGKGAVVKGTIVGGTGRYDGMSGEYEFSWQFVLEGDDGTVQGKSSGLAGRFRAAPASAATRGGSAS